MCWMIRRPMQRHWASLWHLRHCYPDCVTLIQLRCVLVITEAASVLVLY